MVVHPISEGTPSFLVAFYIMIDEILQSCIITQSSIFSNFMIIFIQTCINERKLPKYTILELDIFNLYS